MGVHLKDVIILDRWDAETFVLISLGLQIILTLVGSDRRRARKIPYRLIFWSAYLMVDWVAYSGLTNILNMSDQNNSKSHQKLDLKTRIAVTSLLAPVFLTHLGCPDSVTAHSMADTQMGLREVFDLFLQVGYIIYIIYSCWTDMRISFLAIPIFFAGIINYGLRAAALMSSSSSSHQSDVQLLFMLKEDPAIPEPSKILPKDIRKEFELLLKAYYRFDFLKPHLKDWLYAPEYINYRGLSISDYSPEEVFRITEVELSFMFEALYTKVPSLCTKLGFRLSSIRFLGLLSALCSFPFLAMTKDNSGAKTEIVQSTIVVTFFVLLLTVILEIIEGLRLLLSDWTIVQMIKHQGNCPLLLNPILKLLGGRSKRKKRWSNAISQLDLIKLCMKGEDSTMSKFIKNFFRMLYMDKLFRPTWAKQNAKSGKITPDLKRVVWERMGVVEKERRNQPFDDRGDWALKRVSSECMHAEAEKRKNQPFDEEGNLTLEINCCEFRWLKLCIHTEFGRSIALWHVATQICYYADHAQNTKEKEASKILSHYMMYLLVAQPRLLSPSVAATSNFIVDHTVQELMKFFNGQNLKDQSEACEKLLADFDRKGMDAESEPANKLRWDVLPDALFLAEELMKMGKKWEVISDVWVEMLCYAAWNCDRDDHGEHLRRGGEFITHIWILLYHKTDIYSYNSD